MSCWQEVGLGDLASLVSLMAPSDYSCPSSLYSNGVARNASPPRRKDDKDGHYVFAIGENLTSRCNYTPLSFLKILNFVSLDMLHDFAFLVFKCLYMRI